jgi:hypothetical protein
VVRAALLAAALLLAGCDGDEGEEPDRPSAPSTTGPADTSAETPRGRGLARSNEAEMQDLLASVLRERGESPGRPRCSAVRQLTPSSTRFSCRAGSGRYRIDWEHYGTGAYVISTVEDGRARRIARGTLTISE